MCSPEISQAQISGVPPNGGVNNRPLYFTVKVTPLSGRLKGNTPPRWLLTIGEVLRVLFQHPVLFDIGAVVISIEVRHVALLCLALDDLQPFSPFASILVLRRSVGRMCQADRIDVHRGQRGRIDHVNTPQEVPCFLVSDFDNP